MTSKALISQFNFQRCFLWPTSPIPGHVSYRPPKDRWQSLRHRTEQAIYWLSTSDGAFYLDVWSICIYPACEPSSREPGCIRADSSLLRHHIP